MLSLRRLDDAHRAARHVRAMRALGMATRRRRVPQQLHPVAIEAEYATAQAALVTEATRALAAGLVDLPRILLYERGRRGDGGLRRHDVAGGQRIRALVDEAADRMTSIATAPRIERLAAYVARRTSDHNRRQLQRQIQAGLGVDLPILDGKTHVVIDHFIAQQVAIARDVLRRVHGDVDKLVAELLAGGALPIARRADQLPTGPRGPSPAAELAAQGARAGLTEDQIRAALEQQLQIGETRARWHARDQIGKLNGQLNQVRQLDLGIEHFAWMTRRDPRVRKAHRPRHAQVYRWDDPPGGEIPGGPPLCRCGSVPVFHSLRMLVDDLDAA